MSFVQKDYTKPFALEPTKITALLEHVHKYLGAHHRAIIVDQFEVFQSGNKFISMNSLEEVFQLDNSSSQKIQRFLIKSSATRRSDGTARHEIQIDFGKRKKTISGALNEVPVTEVTIRSDTAISANHALAGVESQIERTYSSFLAPYLSILILLICVLILFLSQFSLPREDDLSHSMWLTSEDISTAKKLVDQNSASDEVSKFISSRQLYNLASSQDAVSASHKVPVRRLVLVGAPLGLIVIAAIFLLPCYPRTVFLWGDGVGRYENLVLVRRTIWIGVFLATIIGVVINLFSTSLLEWLPTK